MISLRCRLGFHQWPRWRHAKSKLGVYYVVRICRRCKKREENVSPKKAPGQEPPVQ